MRLKWKNILGFLVLVGLTIVLVQNWGLLWNRFGHDNARGLPGRGFDLNVAMATVTVGIFVVALAVRNWKRRQGGEP